MLSTIVYAAPGVVVGTKDDTTVRDLLQGHALVARSPDPVPVSQPEQAVWIDEWDNVQAIPPPKPVEENEKSPSTQAQGSSRIHRKDKSTTYFSPFHFLLQGYSSDMDLVDSDKHYPEGFSDRTTSTAIYGALAIAGSICLILIYHTVATKAGGAIRLGNHRRGHSRYSL